MTSLDLFRHSLRARIAYLSVFITAGAISGCGNLDDDQESTDSVESAVTTLGPSYVDGPGEVQSTTCNSMHCCSSGYAMRGINTPANRLWCARIMQPWEETGCAVDLSTVRVNGLHTCPVGQYMKGVDVGRNKLTCCTYTSGNRPTSAFVNGNGANVFINGDYTPANGHWDGPESSEHETTPSGVTVHVCHPGIGVASVMEGMSGPADDLLCAL
jgi:hypothetical protein